MTYSTRFARVAAASALVLGGSLAAAGPAHASTNDSCYSFNKDTAACGWHGAAAPSTGACSAGLAMAAGGAIFPPSWAGLVWGVVSGSSTLATSCGTVVR